MEKADLKDIKTIMIGKMGIKTVMVGEEKVFSRSGGYFYLQLETAGKNGGI